MTVADKLLVFALLAQVVWTFVVMLMAGRARVPAYLAGRAAKDVTIERDTGWPADVRKVSNNMNNQWETPTLFYALVLLALHLHVGSLVLALLAWLWLGLRIGHSVIHITHNRMEPRAKVFFASVAVLMAMTVVVILDVTLGVVI